MLKKIKATVHLMFIITLFGYALTVYFSDEIIIKINKNRVNYFKNINENNSNLQILENDTNDVINYQINNSDKNNFKKRHFWKLLKDE